MKTFEITIYRFTETLAVSHVSFNKESDALTYKSGLFDGLIYSGKNPTGYTVKEYKP